MIYLGLGSNLGARRAHLEAALAALVRQQFRVHRVSPVVETPAMLADDAEPHWHIPYLNCVVEGDFSGNPGQLLTLAKKIERDLGREPGRKWAPRPIDIDILLWHDQVIRQPDLVIPHAGITARDFVITPLLHLRPSLVIPGADSVFNLSRRVKPVPLWMAILNLTPDSFSDGGVWRDREALARQVDALLAHQVQIIDLGAESTRPGAQPVPAAEEWRRLQPVLALIQEKLEGCRSRPWLSLDSRNPTTVERALEAGIDMINDVTGLTDARMLALVRDSGCQAVAMHSLTVPVDSAVLLPSGHDVVAQLRQWIARKAEFWLAAGLSLERIIIDPGIGFGKTPLQAFAIMARCHELRDHGLRVLIGHSRKSFLSGMTDQPPPARDLETLGMSLAMRQRGVDILRVHDAVAHARAGLGWSHIAA